MLDVSLLIENTETPSTNIKPQIKHFKNFSNHAHALYYRPYEPAVKPSPFSISSLLYNSFFDKSI